VKILFLTDNFPPEYNAPATRTFEHCREWVRAGAEVTVITCAPNFPAGIVFGGYRNRLYQRETMEGIEVVRVWTYVAPNSGFVRRIVDYLSFAMMAFFAGLFRRFDVVVATSPQFFTTFAGSALARIRRRPWVFELRDVWPESIVATGSMQPGRAIAALERIELALYRHAALVVAVTDAFKRKLITRGIGAEHVAVIPNGVSQEAYANPPGRERATDGPEGPRRPFVVGYIGTHGLAHGLEVILDAAEQLRDEPFRFLMVGDGARKRALEESATARGLENVDFRDPVPKEDVPSLLASTDVAVIPLKRSETFTTVIPSKIFEAAAARRPIVLGVDGQARELMESYGAGLSFPPEDSAALAGTLRTLAGDARLYHELQGGCERLARDYDRRELALQMLHLIEGVHARRTVGVP
jgi:hypothetical protein